MKSVEIANEKVMGRQIVMLKVEAKKARLHGKIRGSRKRDSNRSRNQR